MNRQRSRNEWVSLLLELREWTGTQAEFAEKHQIKESTVRWQKWRYGQDVMARKWKMGKAGGRVSSGRDSFGSGGHRPGGKTGWCGEERQGRGRLTLSR